MFTGIVQAMGRIAAVESNSFGARLRIDRQGWVPTGGVPLNHGDSICVSGVCLTLTEFDAGYLSFDVIAQTLATSKLGDLRVGDGVNLEPCLTPHTPMGGHVVQGHVDGVGTVTQVRSDAREWRTTIQPPAELMDYIVPKGSITLDGVSLTLAQVERATFQVALIPTTLKLTTLAQWKVGDKVNIETDILARTIVHWLRRQKSEGRDGGSNVSLDSLRQAGFL